MAPAMASKSRLQENTENSGRLAQRADKKLRVMVRVRDEHPDSFERSDANVLHKHLKARNSGDYAGTPCERSVTAHFAV